MKKYTILLVFLIPILLKGQEPKWQMIYGNSGWNEYPEAIIEQYDGGVFITGYSEIFASTTWSIKTDVNGEMLYDKEVNHNLYELSTGAIARDSSGNTFIGGTFWPGNEFLPYVVKLDPCGELLWCKHFAIAPNSIGGFTGDIILNQNNELIVLMSFSTLDTDDQIYLGCLDINGNELWFKPYARKQAYPLLVNPVAWDLLEHNNEYYIAGYGYYPYPNNPNHVYQRPLFIGINGNFQEKFVIPFYALDSVFGKANVCIPINDTIVMGAGIRRLDGSKDNSLLMFIKTNGEEIGFRQIANEQIGPNINNNYIHDLERINDTLFIAGAPYGEDLSLNPVGEIVFDTSGNVYNIASHPNTETKPELIKTSELNFIIATSIYQGNDTDILLYKIDKNLNPVPFDTTQHVYDSLCHHTIQSGEMDLTNCLVITSIEDWPTPDKYYESIRWIPIKAYPNPVMDGKLTLEFENTEHHQNMELRCYDDFGRQIRSQIIYKGQQDTDVDVSAWPTGIYIAVVYSNGGARGKVKFVVSH